MPLLCLSAAAAELAAWGARRTVRVSAARRDGSTSLAAPRVSTQQPGYRGGPSAPKPGSAGGSRYTASGGRAAGNTPLKVEPQRLAKVMAAAGVASRRACEALIAEGVVSVNGTVITTQGTTVNPRTDMVVVHGKKLAVAQAPELYYFAVNKPKGYICSNVDTQYGPQESRRAIDLLEPWLDEWKKAAGKTAKLPPRFYTVGRLDVPSYGLIFITNDGEWAQKVSHPSHEVTKEYIVQTARVPSRAHIERMMEGVQIDGVLATPLEISTLDDEKRLRVVVAEGRKHEVRLLVEAAGHSVISLKRVRIGGYRLDRSIGVGSYLELTAQQARMVLDVKAQERASQMSAGAIKQQQQQRAAAARLPFIA